MNSLEKNWKTSNLLKTLSFELNTSMNVFVFVHLPLIEKQNDLPFIFPKDDAILDVKCGATTCIKQ
jgi:hypothetical protein